MAEQDEFQITLPSTASVETFPKNNQANWITLMQPSIVLRGDWTVALTDMCVPTTWFNVTQSNSEFTVQYGYLHTDTVILNEFVDSASALAYSLRVDIDIDNKKDYSREEYFRAMSIALAKAVNKELPDTGRLVPDPIDPSVYFKEPNMRFSDQIKINSVSIQPENLQRQSYFALFISTDFSILFDASSISEFSLPLARFLGLRHNELFKPIDDTIRVSRYDNFDGETKEYTARLRPHHFYILPLNNHMQHMRENQITITTMAFVDSKCSLKTGHYSSNQMLVKALNDCLPVEAKQFIRFALNHTNKFLKIISQSPTKFYVKFPNTDNGLGRMLGVPRNDLGQNLPNQEFGYDLHSFWYQGKYSIEISRGCHAFYVYCDIVSQEHVGDKMANLLSILPVRSSNLTEYRFQQFANYKNVSVKAITSVHIVIKTDSGEEVNFDGGKSWCTLHFRKKQ